MRVDRRVKQILARREAALQQARRAAESLKRAVTGPPVPAAPDGGRTMASSVEIHRAAHDAFNERGWERMRSLMAGTIAYSDRPRGLELGSFDEFLGWLKEWTTGMSDARVDDPDYLEAGEYSVCRFHGRGINDGPMGPARATTGKRMDMPFCEILRVQNGRVISGEIFYDQLTMLTQLGLAEAPVPA
jgi:predicted ester cyclase